MAKAESKIRLSPPVALTILAWPKRGKRRTSRRRNESDFSICTFPNPVSSHQMTRPAHQSTLGFTSASFFLRVPIRTLSLSSLPSNYYYSRCPFYSSSSDLSNTTTSLCVARSARQHRFALFAHIRLRTVRPTTSAPSPCQQNP